MPNNMQKITEYILKLPCKVMLYSQDDDQTTVKNITKIQIYEPTMAYFTKINYSFLGYIKDKKQENGFNKASVELNNSIRVGALSPEHGKMFMELTDFIKDKLNTRHATSDAEHTSACLSLLTTPANIINENNNEELRTLLFSPEAGAWLTAEDLRNLSMLDMQNILKIIDNFFFKIAEQIG